MGDLLGYVQSESNPDKSYKITRGSDGVIYCECWAWKMHKNCKHLATYFSEQYCEQQDPIDNAVDTAINKLRRNYE